MIQLPPLSPHQHLSPPLWLPQNPILCLLWMSWPLFMLLSLSPHLLYSLSGVLCPTVPLSCWEEVHLALQKRRCLAEWGLWLVGLRCLRWWVLKVLGSTSQKGRWCHDCCNLDIIFHHSTFLLLFLLLLIHSHLPWLLILSIADSYCDSSLLYSLTHLPWVWLILTVSDSFLLSLTHSYCLWLILTVSDSYSDYSWLTLIIPDSSVWLIPSYSWLLSVV